MEKDLQNRDKTNFEKVREFVNAFDPCGLIHFGFPEDEYDCLTNHLLLAVYQKKSRDDIRSLILHEIDHHFGEPDRSILVEPYRTQFYNDIETLLDKLEEHFYNKTTR